MSRRRCDWQIRFGLGRRRRRLLRQKFALGQSCLPDDELSRKQTAFFDRDRFRGYVPIERSRFVNRDRPRGHNFGRHAPFDVDAANGYAAETLNVRFALDDDVRRAEASRNFSGKVNGHGFFALQVAAQFSFDQRGLANNACAAQITLAGEMNVAARPNRPTKTRRDFVIAKIDVRAAPRTICRCRRFTDFVFPLALETGDNAVSLTVPNTLKPTVNRNFCRSSGTFLF